MSAHPLRIQRQRTRGWRLPTAGVVITRPTLYGNPFRCDDPALAVAAYRARCAGGPMPELGGPANLRIATDANPHTLRESWATWLRCGLLQLRGRPLCCWCDLASPCHGDILAELANGRT